jgi:hypothetical protein
MPISLALVVAVIAAARGMWSPCGLSMLSSLNPVSETARGNRFWLTAVWYVVGAVVGGALLGLVCAGLALVWPFAAAPVVLVVALVAVASDTAVFGRSLPDHPRQVDERWLVKYRRWIYAGGYGLQIGTGFATYIMTAAVYLTAVLAVASGSFWTAFGLCVVFGAVRGLTIVVAAFARTPALLRTIHARLAALAGASLWCAVAASAAAAVVAGWSLGGPLLAALAFAACATCAACAAASARRAARPGGLRRVVRSDASGAL